MCGLNPNDPQSRRCHIFGWGKDIIESRSDSDDYELDTLESVLEVAKRVDNETAVYVMEFLIEARKYPSVMHAAKTKEDALAIIEANTTFPIRHPEWFKNEWNLHVAGFSLKTYSRHLRNRIFKEQNEKAP